MQSLDDWSSLCSSNFVPMQVAGRGAFEGRIVSQELPSIGLSRVAATPSTVHRTRDLVSSDPRDVVLVSLYLKGVGTVAQDGRVATLRAGEANILDADRPYTVRLDGANDLILLRVPRSSVGVRSRTLRGCLNQRIGSGHHALRALRAYAGHSLQDATTPDETEHVTGELLRALVHPLAHGSASVPRLGGAALYESARCFFEDNSADPQLSVEAVASAHGVTRRAIERQFAERDRSPASYLRNLRLAHARRLLVSEPDSTIMAISARVGFADPTTFIRAFNRELGLPPERWRRRRLLHAANGLSPEAGLTQTSFSRRHLDPSTAASGQPANSAPTAPPASARNIFGKEITG